MKLTLTQSQAEALKHLFDAVINVEMPEGVEGLLLQLLLKRVYKKLRDRVEQIGGKKPGYSVKVNPEECIAFYLYFRDRNFGPQWLYEQTVVDRLVRELDRVVA